MSHTEQEDFGNRYTSSSSAWMTDELDPLSTSDPENGSGRDFSQGNFVSLYDLEKVLTDHGVTKELKSSLNLIAVPLLIMATLAVGFLLKWAEDILVPFVIAVFFTYLLRPIVDALSQPWGKCYLCCVRQRHRSPSAGEIELASLLNYQQTQGVKEKPEDDADGVFVSAPTPPPVEPSLPPGSGRCARTCWACKHAKLPRWMSVSIAMAIVVGVITLFVLLIADAIQKFERDELESYENRTAEVVNFLLDWLKRNFNVDGSYMREQIEGQFEIIAVTKGLLLTTMNGVTTTFIVFLFVLYMLFEEDGPRTSGINRSHSRAAHLRRQIDSQIQRYLVIKTVISGVVGIFVYLTLGPILNVKMAHLFGVITFLANFIPNVGAVIATIVPFPIIVLDPNLSTLNMILAFVVPVTIHTMVGNVVEPKVFGASMELHPVVVMLSLSFWFSVWGIPGAILSVPITAVIRIVVSNIKHPYTRIALRLLEGKLPGSTEFHS